MTFSFKNLEIQTDPQTLGIEITLQQQNRTDLYSLTVPVIAQTAFSAANSSHKTAFFSGLSPIAAKSCYVNSSPPSWTHCFPCHLTRYTVLSVGTCVCLSLSWEWQTAWYKHTSLKVIIRHLLWFVFCFVADMFQQWFVKLLHIETAVK